LACWLGLIFWLQLGPGGAEPPPKADPAWIRVVTWNIHCGGEHGPPWQRFDWPSRKHALGEALSQVDPDILCVQEARPDQGAFLKEVPPGHNGAGRGRDEGEHWAIYFRRDRFEDIDSDTFGLTGRDARGRAAASREGKRICPGPRLRDRRSGRVLRVYNTHQYL